jgi:hypothetical protein
MYNNIKWDTKTTTWKFLMHPQRDAVFSFKPTLEKREIQFRNQFIIPSVWEGIWPSEHNHTLQLIA